MEGIQLQEVTGLRFLMVFEKNISYFLVSFLVSFLVLVGWCRC